MRFLLLIDELRAKDGYACTATGEQLIIIKRYEKRQIDHEIEESLLRDEILHVIHVQIEYWCNNKTREFHEQILVHNNININ